MTKRKEIIIGFMEKQGYEFIDMHGNQQDDFFRSPIASDDNIPYDIALRLFIAGEQFNREEEK